MVATQQKTAEKLTAKAVGREFVRQYYTMLAKEPRFLHRFYGSSSEMMHGNKDDQFPAVGQSKIREKIKSLNFKDCHTKVAQLDAFLTIGNGICIQVAGEISNNQEPLRRFMQTFVLGPQERDGAEPGTSFYVHNDIFRYQDDIFTDDYPPAEPVEIEKYEEDSPLPQDNGDHAAQAYYNSTQSVEPIQAISVPQPQSTEPEVQPVEVPVEPVVAPVIVPEPEQIVEQSEPPQVGAQEPEPIQEPEMVQQEEPEPVSEPVSVPVPEVSNSEPVQEEEKPVPVQQSNAPMSWAARMRSNTANQSVPSSANQAPPAQASVPAPVPVQKAVPKQTTPTPQQPQPVDVARDVVEGPGESGGGFSQVPAQNQSRENRNQENRYNRDRNYEREDRPRREFNDDKQQIFVGGLPNTMSETDIREVFSKFGQVKHVRMNMSNTGRPGAGFGFVTFAKEEAAREALQNKDNIFFNKLQLNIEEKKTRERREGGGRGGYSQPNGNNGKPRDDRNYRSRDGGYNRDGGRGGGRTRDGNRGGNRNPKF